MPGPAGCATSWRAGVRCRAETRNYVMAITGMSVDDWAKGARSAGEAHAQPAGENCHDLVALLKQAHDLFVEELQERRAPGGSSSVLASRASACSQLMQICSSALAR
jgi:hypothetical protein